MAAENPNPRPASRLRPRNRAKRCFELSGRYQMDDPTWTLVHGSIVAEGSDFRFAHGWLKRDGWVYDAVLDESMRAEEYALRFAAEELATYTSKETARAMLDSGNWGPWVPYDRRRVAGAP